MQQQPAERADSADAVEERIAEVRAQYNAGQLDGEDFFPMLSDLRARAKELRKLEAEEERSATQRAALHDPLEVWENGSLTAKRALLAGLIKGVYVKPTGQIGRGPAPSDSVKVVPA